jgi:hypothetical protein
MGPQPQVLCKSYLILAFGEERGRMSFLGKKS